MGETILGGLEPKDSREDVVATRRHHGKQNGRRRSIPCCGGYFPGARITIHRSPGPGGGERPDRRRALQTEGLIGRFAKQCRWPLTEHSEEFWAPGDLTLNSVSARVGWRGESRTNFGSKAEARYSEPAVIEFVPVLYTVEGSDGDGHFSSKQQLAIVFSSPVVKSRRRPELNRNRPMPWMRMRWETDGLCVGWVEFEIRLQCFFPHVALSHRRQTRQTTGQHSTGPHVSPMSPSSLSA